MLTDANIQPVASQRPKALIVVLGRSGVGKSSFINSLAGKGVLQVGHSLENETQLPSLVEIPPPNSEDIVAFLDTPGIDDGTPANEVLLGANAWLKSNDKDNVHFGGFLVLEESHARHRPEALPLLVGYQSLLVLTKLGYSPNKNEDLYKSATLFDPPTREKAWEIVDKILEQSTGATSVRLETGVVFEKILQESQKPTRRENLSARFLRFLASFRIW